MIRMGSNRQLSSHSNRYDPSLSEKKNQARSICMNNSVKVLGFAIYKLLDKLHFVAKEYIFGLSTTVNLKLWCLKILPHLTFI